MYNDISIAMHDYNFHGFMHFYGHLSLYKTLVGKSHEVINTIKVIQKELICTRKLYLMTLSLDSYKKLTL